VAPRQVCGDSSNVKACLILRAVMVCYHKGRHSKVCTNLEQKEKSGMRSLLKTVLRIFLRQFRNIGWGRFSRLAVKREILPFIQTHDGATKI